MSGRSEGSVDNDMIFGSFEYALRRVTSVSLGSGLLKVSLIRDFQLVGQVI